MSDIVLGQGAVLEIQAWATPAPGVSLDDLVEEFRVLGNPILAVDRENNRILARDDATPINGTTLAALLGSLKALADEEGTDD